MKAKIVESRFVIGNEMSLDSLCNYLKKYGISREDAENHIKILCDNGLCVKSSANGYTILATPDILNSL